MTTLAEVARELEGRALPARVGLVGRASESQSRSVVMRVRLVARAGSSRSVGVVVPGRLVLSVPAKGVQSVGGVRGGVSVRVAPGAVRVSLSAGAMRARMAAARCGIRGAAIGGLRQSARVRVRAMAVWPGVGGPRDCGRSAWALESWAELPGPWASVVVPDVGYVGRSLASLDWLRGASVEWQESTGRVLVAGRVVIGDDGLPVLVDSSAVAMSVIVRGAAAIEAAIGVAAGYSGDERERRMNAIRKGQRGTVTKAAKWIGHPSLSVGQSRALQAEFNWRERRL